MTKGTKKPWTRVGKLEARIKQLEDRAEKYRKYYKEMDLDFNNRIRQNKGALDAVPQLVRQELRSLLNSLALDFQKRGEEY